MYHDLRFDYSPRLMSRNQWCFIPATSNHTSHMTAVCTQHYHSWLHNHKGHLVTMTLFFFWKYLNTVFHSFVIIPIQAHVFKNIPKQTVIIYYAH